jgi:arylsulfatase A-like enzyme
VQPLNFLFLLPDQFRPDFVGALAEMPVRTPNLDSLAARGTLFTRALCASPLCAPARAALASGKDYARCGVWDNSFDYPLDQPTYYGLLRDSGYHVAGVGKFDLQKGSANHSLDGKALIHEWGFSDGIDSKGKWDAYSSWDGEPHDAYLAYLASHGLAETHIADFASRRGDHRSYTVTHPTPLPHHAYGDTWITENGLRLLRDFPEDRPWHLVVNFTGPHEPLDATESMLEGWRDVEFPLPIASNQFDWHTHQRIRQNYAAIIENIDRQIGRLIDAVAARGELENTVVVFSSDHGEMLGDHGLWSKTRHYQQSVGVPLIAAGPGIRAGQFVDSPVALHDLAPTLLDYAGLPIPDEMDAVSLRPILEGQTDRVRDFVLAGMLFRGQNRGRGWRLIFDGRYKLVFTEDGQTLLFDLDDRPCELRDMSAERPAELERLRALMPDDFLQA